MSFRLNFLIRLVPFWGVAQMDSIIIPGEDGTVNVFSSREQDDNDVLL